MVGQHTEMITVVEAPAQVETANTHMGELITGTRMTGIPVNGRS